MTRESLERAKSLISCIESAEEKIKKFERICEAGKGEIVICTKEKLSGGHGNVDSIYISKEMLDVIKNAYVGYWESMIDEKRKEFEKLR